MITNIGKLKKEYGFDFLSFHRNRITNTVEIKAGKFNKKGASKGIWVDVDESLLVPGVYKLTEIDSLSGHKKAVGEKTITKEETKKNIKTVMNILKEQYRNIMENGAFKDIEEGNLVQHAGFEHEAKYEKK